jgi:broad specificity phosphatase PhoE
VPVTITFIRHAESAGNVAGLWQGHTDSALSEMGQAQVERLARRFAGAEFDAVVSSDLQRTVATAAALNGSVVTDPRWREPFLGDWENLATDAVMRQSPGALQALLRGDDIALGGGERLSEVLVRTRAALDELIATVGKGSVAVVSHGLALLTIVTGLLRTKLPSPLHLMGNAAATIVTYDDGRYAVPRYNDDTHLGALAGTPYGHRGDETHVLLIRHGRTRANVEGRWQGRSDTGLTAEGMAQAEALSKWIPPLDALYSSPLSRAVITAEAVAAPQELPVRVLPGLEEIGFGAWEGLTREEIAARYPAEYAEFRSGADVRRGGTGETWVEVCRRMEETVAGITAGHPGGAVGIVSHGGATRAYVATLLGLGYADRHRLSILENTGYAKVDFTGRGPSLVGWNLAPHLERGG